MFMYEKRLSPQKNVFGIFPEQNNSTKFDKEFRKYI